MQFRPLACLLFGSLAWTECLSAATLEELFTQAETQSEVLRSSQLDVQIAAQSQELARIQSRPRVNFSADTAYVVTKPDRQDWDNAIDPGLRTEFRQPLYDGGLTSASLRRSESLIKTAEWTSASRREELFLQIAALFYEILRLEQDLKNLNESLDLYGDRVSVLARWEKIGRSRVAEVLAARTQVELTESQILSTRTALGLAQEQLAWLVGASGPVQPTDTLSLANLNQAPSPPVEGFYPTIEAAKAQIAFQSAQMELAEVGNRPVLDFIAAHDWRYVEEPLDQGRHRFSVGLGLTWTLYDAGLTRSQVATAALAKSQATLEEERARRLVQLNLSLVDRNLQDGLLQYKALKKALDVADRNVRVQRGESEVGLITNLEVLEALNQRLQIRRDMDMALFRSKLAFTERQIRLGLIGKPATSPAPP